MNITNYSGPVTRDRIGYNKRRSLSLSLYDSTGSGVVDNSELLNGQLPEYYLDWSNFINTPTTLAGYGITDSFDGSFISLTNKPTTLFGYGITDGFSGKWEDLTGAPTLATVAITGSYNNLTDLPVYAMVATTGDYNDLLNKPSGGTGSTSNHSELDELDYSNSGHTGFASSSHTHTGTVTSPGSSTDREILTWNGTSGDSVRVSTHVSIASDYSVLSSGDVVAYQSGAYSGSIWDAIPVTKSIVYTGGYIQLDGDLTTPTDGYVYGYTTVGGKGWYAQSGGGSSQWTTDTYGITYASNVGIGIASNASYKLHVYGNVIFGSTSGGTYNGNCLYNNSDQYPNFEFRAGSTTKGGFTVAADTANVYIATVGGSVVFRKTWVGDNTFVIENTGWAYLNTYTSARLGIGASPSTSACPLMLYSSGTDASIGTRTNTPFYIFTNDTNKITILANGNIGIGTASPGSGVTMTGGLTINGTGSTMLSIMNNGTNSFALNPGAAGAAWTMYDYADGTWKACLYGKSGKIGIGTSTPGQDLSVRTTIGLTNDTQTWYLQQNSGEAIIHNGYGQMTLEADGDIVFKTYNGSYIPRMTISDGTGGVSIGNPISGATLTLGRYSGNPNVKSSDGYMILDSLGGFAALNHYVTDNVALASGGGKVGVGTSTPDGRLHIKQLSNGHAGGLLQTRSDATNSWALTTGGDNAFYWGYSTTSTGHSTVMYLTGSASTPTLFLGDTTSTGSTTPTCIDMGSRFSSSAGSYPKIILHGSGYGLGVSSSNFNFMVPTGASYTWYINAVQKMQLDTSANLTVVGEITAYYSDMRLKTAIQPIINAVDKVKRLSAFTYVQNELANSLTGSIDNERKVGLSAQEMQMVLPEAVRLAPFDNENGKSKSGENYLTVQYEKIVPLLIEAIKELKQEIEELKHGNIRYN